jgi:hypothetical protein
LLPECWPETENALAGINRKWHNPGPAPKWWNWQTRCVQGAVPYGCAGSNPAFGTKISRPTALPPRWGGLLTGHEVLRPTSRDDHSAEP